MEKKQWMMLKMERRKQEKVDKEKVKWIEFHEFIFLTIPFVTCCHIPHVNNLK